MYFITKLNLVIVQVLQKTTRSWQLSLFTNVHYAVFLIWEEADYEDPNFGIKLLLIPLKLFVRKLTQILIIQTIIFHSRCIVQM